MAESGNIQNDLSALRSILYPDEIITPDSPSYQTSIQTWASQKQLNPRLVIRPACIESLSKVTSYLYSTDLEFAFYGHGFSSASAKDVLINVSAFDDFHFDKHSELVTIGAGQTWAEVYRKLGEVAPDYGVVGARTPCVGVAGTILSGGFSWLSVEHGCISDPSNMLDVKIVKYDGSVVWASKEPELLWALRGGGGGFGVIVQAVLRVFPYPQDIWAGPILVPREQLQKVAKGISQFTSGPVDPKITMFLYVVKKRLLESLGTNSDMMVIHAFDAHGEEHGRANFQWALEISGAVDQTKVTTLKGVADLQDKAHIISEDTVIKAIKWSEDIQHLDESLADCTYLIFELLSSREPAGSTSSCAWPRPAGMKHILLMGTGCPSEAGLEKEHLARDLAIQAASKILGQEEEIHYLPNGFEDFHDPMKAYLGTPFHSTAGAEKAVRPTE